MFERRGLQQQRPLSSSSASVVAAAYSSSRMAPLSIRLLVFINFLTLLLSLVILGISIWLAERGYHCSSRLQWLVISIGIIMFVISFIGLAGARRRILGLIWLYIALLTLIILLLIIFTTFAFLLKSHGFQDIIRVGTSTSAAASASVVSTASAASASVSESSSTHEALSVSSLLSSASSCRVQALLSFEHDWGIVAIVSLVVLLVLLLIYAVACSAFVRAMNQGAFLHTF
jgi:hypothetical protein